MEQSHPQALTHYQRYRDSLRKAQKKFYDNNKERINKKRKEKYNMYKQAFEQLQLQLKKTSV